MSKKKFRTMMIFVAFTFILLAVAISYEVISYFNTKEDKVTVENQYQSASSTNNEVVLEESKDVTQDNNDLDNDKIAKNTTDDSKSSSTETNSTRINNTANANRTTSSEVFDNDNKLNSNRNATNSNQVKEETNSDEIVLTFAGDIYISDIINSQYNKKGIAGILSPDLLQEIKQADIAMANQEFPFSSNGKPMKNKQYTFRVEPKLVNILKDMQLDIVTLANNHVLDFGNIALLDTFSTLDRNNIKYVGAGTDLAKAKEPKYFEINNRKIAILGASRVIPEASWNAGNQKAGLLTTYDPTLLIEEIKKAKETSDFVITYIHWGIERKLYPEDYQRKLAKQYIDAGADVVVGSHPHVLQGMEYYKGKPIVYSLGNFIFYNSIDKTALLKVTLNDKMTSKVQLIPCASENGKTYILHNKTEIKKFYKSITDLSYDTGINDNGFVVNKK